jgi:hypothetical protein
MMISIILFIIIVSIALFGIVPDFFIEILLRF